MVEVGTSSIRVMVIDDGGLGKNKGLEDMVGGVWCYRYVFLCGNGWRAYVYMYRGRSRYK